MKRELIFKIYNKTNKRFYEWYDFFDEKLHEVFDNETLIPLQYTGVNDINDEELYEGDICEVEDWFPSDYKEKGFNGHIEFDDGNFYIIGKDSMEYQNLDKSSVINRKIKKIGNIYNK